MIKLIELKESDNALVGVVVTFLLIGLIVSVISIIQTVYVPKWMEQTESEHMDEVADQFAQMKSAIDMQGVIGLNQQTYTSVSTISTSITLGSRELPFFLTARAYGSLNILPEASFRVVIVDNLSKISDITSETIQYSSANAYYLDQTYIYEGGAVVLSQEQGDIIMTKPTFSAMREDLVNISFTLYKISKVGGKGSISGYGTYPILTEYLSGENSVINNVTSITIYTKYQNAWSNFINGTFINGGLVPPNEYYTIDNSYNGRLIINFTPENPVTLNLYVIKIMAQIAPGWIENT